MAKRTLKTSDDHVPEWLRNLKECPPPAGFGNALPLIAYPTEEELDDLVVYKETANIIWMPKRRAGSLIARGVATIERGEPFGLNHTVIHGRVRNQSGRSRAFQAIIPIHRGVGVGLIRFL